MLKKLYLLFINTFIVSASANSGYAIIAYMRKLFVERYKWLSREEMDNYMALAQSSPGPIGVNAAILVGYHVAGIWGAFTAVFALIIPPFAIMLAVSFFYNAISHNEYVRLFVEGMLAGVIAMLIDVEINLFVSIDRKKQPIYYLLIIFAFIYIRFSKLSIFYLAIICMLTAIIKTFLIKRKAERS